MVHQVCTTGELPDKDQEGNALDFIELSSSEIAVAVGFTKSINGVPLNHEEHVRKTAQESAVFLQRVVDLANTWAERVNAVFSLTFVDSPHYFANVSSSWDVKKRMSFEIKISLGCIPRLLGLSNRVLAIKRFGVGAISLHDHADWDPNEDPLGMLWVFPEDQNQDRDRQNVLDSLCMMLLHEISHACCGHLNHRALSRNQRRALETEADWGSGRLFFEIHRALQTSPGHDSPEMVGRMFDAALTNFTALQFANPRALRKDFYHYPVNRTSNVLQGANDAWTHFGLSQETFHAEYEKFVGYSINVYPLIVDPHVDQVSPDLLAEDREIANSISAQLVMDSRKAIGGLAFGPLFPRREI